MLVYWIHYREHTDPYSDGYIGVTNNLDRRLYEHSSKHSKCHHVKNRLNNGAIVSILHYVDTLSEALELEEKYRPVDNIGWNICKGGSYPPNQTGKIFDTNRLVGEDRTEAQKSASKLHSQRMKNNTPWNAGLKGSQIAWNKGKKLPNPNANQNESTCPHCGKTGKGSSMMRWHFSNCKFKVGI